MRLYHGTDVFSADKILREGINVRAGRKGLDFGTGFYVTPRLSQAKIWAQGTVAPCVLSMELDETGLKILGFDAPTREWAEFVVKNRLRLIEDTGYDCVYGPMADYGISRLYAQYKAGKITIEKAIEKVRKDPNGWQWVVLTERAVKNIKEIRKVER